jgi:heptosyltransferase-2
MIEKILIVQTAFIGDAILTLPMIQKLKEINPDSIFDVVAIPSTKDIFAASPAVNKVFVLDKRGTHKSIFKMRKLAKELAFNDYSRLYSPHRSLRTSLLVMMTGIKNTYGFSNSELKYAYKHIIKYRPDKHEVQRNLDLIGFEYDDELWRISPIITPEYSDTVKEIISGAGARKIAAIAPGSIWATKKYPADYYLKIIQFLTSINCYIVLLGGADDYNECENIRSGLESSVCNAAGKLKFVESAALLENAFLLVCNDSAPAHLGQAANVNTLMLYCSTIPEFGFAPYLKGSEYISLNGLKCKPCGIHGHMRCPINTFECGVNLMPEMVISKLKEKFI